MHWEQTEFVRSLKRRFPSFFSGVSVLEIGSYDVNGSIRPEFEAARHVGVDLIEGPGVDVVSSGEAFRSDERFDVVISTECFEHNPRWRETFLNMAAHARAGGMVTFTCASEGRPEHGTERCDPQSSPGSLSVDAAYYRNLVESDFADVDLASLFSEHRFYRNHASHDLYFVGFRAAASALDGVAADCATAERLTREADAAFARLASGDAEGAAAAMEAVLSSAPPQARGHMLARSGWLLLNAGRAAEAEARVREALASAEEPQLRWQLANALHAQGRAQEAIVEAGAALARSPKNPDYLYFLGALLADAGDLGEAESLLDRTLAAAPRHAHACLQLSMIRVRQGRRAEALAFARRAAEAAPDHAMVAEHLRRLEPPPTV